VKIAFIGSRGIPANYGGFETFVEEVAVGLKNTYNYDIVVVGDSLQKIQLKGIKSYKGIKIKYSTFSKANQTILFYLDSMFKVWNSDIIYSCGVGNAFFLFIPFFLKKKFVTNPDGIGWKRLKWSNNGKKILKFMFFLSAKLSPFILADSIGIQQVFEDRFNRKKQINTIEYGAYLNNTIGDNSQNVKKILQKFNLTGLGYHLVVSRLEPENNVDQIIHGYLKTDSKRPLVIVGNIMETDYVRDLLKFMSKRIIFLGGIYERFALEVIRANAFSYIHGHSVGGTNPSLLEAMASKNICICHKNQFNIGVVSDAGFYFENDDDLSRIITEIEINNYSEYRELVYNRVINHFSWKNIIRKYSEYFTEIVK